MKKIISKTINKVLNNEVSINKNYKLFRFIEKIISMPTLIKRDFEDIIFDLTDRKIKARVFSPGVKSKGMIIYIHGGGWVLGSIDSYTKSCNNLSKKTNRIVIAIDYRLAPEYPFPNGFNDCYEVVKMIMDNSSIMEIKQDDICLMGDSAGGNLVAALSIKSRKTKDFKIKKQILLYPALQLDYSSKTKYKSVMEKGQDNFLIQKHLQEYVSLYIKKEKDLENPLVSPLRHKFPIFQPETLILTADNDPLRDEGKAYAKKLKLCFNIVEYYNINNAFHGFFSNPLDKKSMDFAYEKIIKFLGDINESKK